MVSDLLVAESFVFLVLFSPEIHSSPDADILPVSKEVGISTLKSLEDDVIILQWCMLLCVKAIGI